MLRPRRQLRWAMWLLRSPEALFFSPTRPRRWSRQRWRAQTSQDRSVKIHHSRRHVYLIACESQLARRIFYSFAKPGSEYMFVQDIQHLFPDDIVDRVFSIFDRDGNGDASREEVEMALMCVQDGKTVSARLTRRSQGLPP